MQLVLRLELHCCHRILSATDFEEKNTINYQRHLCCCRSEG